MPGLLRERAGLSCAGEHLESAGTDVDGRGKEFYGGGEEGRRRIFKRTLTDDFSFVGVDGQLGDRQAMVDHYANGGQNLQPYGMKVVTTGVDAAIVTCDAVVQVPPVQDQGPPPRYQHFSAVWVKQGHAWNMKFQQTTAAQWGHW